MTDPASDPRAPGERRLDRPPSDRYHSTSAAEVDRVDAAHETGRAGSPARGIAFGAIAGLAGAVATVVLGGVLAISAGLLVVAAATGYAVALAVAAGAGLTSGADRMAGADPTAGTNPTAEAGRRRPAWRWIATALAAAGVLLGQLGLWLFARTEGGVLTLPDYLGQTFGWVVPLQVLLAGVVAWWTAR